MRISSHITKYTFLLTHVASF